MVEVLVGLSFLFSLWVFGRTLLFFIACHDFFSSGRGRSGIPTANRYRL